MKIRKIMAAVLCAAVMMSGCTFFGGTDESSTELSSISESSSKESSTAESSEKVKTESSEESSEPSKAPDPEKHYIELEVLETYDIKAPKNAKTESSDTDVAFINDKGEIEAKNAGKANVSVTLDGTVTDIYVVTVKEKTLPFSLPESSDVTDNNNTITPTVWEVTDTDGHIVYMMGSIHVADENALYLPDYFEAAFDRCDYLGVECDNSKVDTTSGMDLLKDYLYTDGTRIYDHVDKTAYDNMVKWLTNYSRYSRALDSYKPFLWVEYVELTAAQICGLEAQYGVDNIVMNLASRKRKKILELESVEQQTEMLASLTDEMQEKQFNRYSDAKEFENVVNEVSELYDLWKTGKMNDENMTTDYEKYEKEIEKISDPEKQKEAREELEVFKGYNEALLDKRNKGMADKISGYLGSDMRVMVVVGSAHYYGKTGIVSLLEERGCTVRTLSTEDADRLGYIRQNAA